MDEYEPLLKAKGQNEVDAAYRHIVLANPTDYPTLHDLEKKRNAWRFQNGEQ